MTFWELKRRLDAPFGSDVTKAAGARGTGYPEGKGESEPRQRNA